MALEQEDKDAIREILSEVLVAQNKGGDKKTDPEPGDDALREAAAKAAAEEKATKDREAAIADSVKFNSRIRAFVTENIDAFGGATGEKLLQMVAENTKNDKEVERANEYRKQFIDQFIASQANIDVLPSGAKDLIEKYRGLPEAEKRTQSAKFWTIIESGLEINKQVKKAKQMAIAKDAGSDSFKEIPKHIMFPCKK